jgi:SNF2 family DNA or RNA helicase
LPALWPRALVVFILIVLYHDGRARFEAITSWMERDLPKQERWRWDSVLKRWYTASEDIARRLSAYATGAAALRLNQLSPAEKASLEASHAHEAPESMDMPCPPGLSYLPFQRAGIAYALNRRGTLIGDEMGLGKTVEAIGTVNMLPEARRVLIVCPASLRLNWRAEWQKWHTGKLRPTLLENWPRGLFDPAAGKALIVSYDSVRKWHPMIAAQPWDVLIVDEAHMLKDEGTRRAKSLFGGTYKHREKFEPILARRKLFLTGTAIVNRATDLWPLVKALAPEGLGKSRVDFVERYSGDNRLPELHLRLRTQIMVRRKKDDVLKELPKKRRQIVLLDVADAEGIVQAEFQALSFAKAQLERARAEIAGLPHGEQVMRLRQCRSIAMSEISRVRKETAMKKLPAAIEHIHEALGNVDKLCVYGHHHDVMDTLGVEFNRIAVTLDGRTSEAGRQTAVDRFQCDRRVRLFLGSIRAAGLGITLTAASTVVFVELDWTPAAMMQSEDRLHRIGQHSPVLVQHLVIDGSIDAKMARILVGKQATMDAALDGGTPDRHDILEELMA